MDYSKNKKLHLPYMIAAGIEMWWALIYIYIPLFIIKSGLKENIIGIFLAVIIIPLILFEFEVGKFSDKYGFKKFFIFGFGFLSLASVLAYNYSNNMYVVLLIFVLASIPMAMLEPLQDSYFFKQVKEDEEEKYYPIFATAGDIGSFISKFSIAGILLLFPTSYVYLFIAFLMGIIAIISFKIKD